MAPVTNDPRGCPGPRLSAAAADRRSDQRGSVVLVALCLCTVLAVSVVGFFAVCARTMELSNRSYVYTTSLLLAENGIEEAMWSLDQALNTSGYSWTGWTLARRGQNFSGSGMPKLWWIALRKLVSRL